MFFLLGALSSGLVALMVLPAFWRRAMRLSRRQLEVLMPLSVEEIVAERDLLRAEFAAEQRQVEQKIEAQTAAHGETLAELGRRAVTIAGLQDALARLSSAHEALKSDYAISLRARHEAEGERGAMLIEIHDTLGLNERQGAEYRELAKRHEVLQSVCDALNADIVMLEMKAASLNFAIEGHIEDAQKLNQQIVAGQEQGLEQARQSAAECEQLMEMQRAVELRLDEMRQQYEAEHQHCASLQSAIEAMTAEAAQNRDIIDETENALARAKSHAEHVAEDAAHQVREMVIQLSDLKTNALSSELAAGEYIEALQQEIARLGDELTAREAVHSALPPGQNSALHSSGKAIPLSEDQAVLLRLAIAEVGAKVAALAGESK